MKPYSIWRKIILILGIAWMIFATKLVSLPASAEATPAQAISNEIRGVWITNVASGVLFAPWGIHRALNQLAALNFNTIYPVAWNRGYTFYPSATSQKAIGRRQAPIFSLMHPGADVLEDMVQLGHRRQLRVIPWFEYGFMIPRQSQLVLRHPDWLSTDAEGNARVDPDWSSIFEGDRQAIRAWVGKQNSWLNPFHPEVQEFILQMIVEVVTNYDVDGIQLDDHFGLPIELGYDPFTAQLYQQSHQGKSPPSNPSDAEWVRWRADKISAFMGKIAETVRSIKPDCIVSLSPNPQEFAYNYSLQDWSRWVQEGWVDELVLQVYRQELSHLQPELFRASVQAARQRIPVVIGLISGVWSDPVDNARLRDQINLVRQNRFDGVSFFYWESLMGYLAPESPYQRQRFLREMFAPS